MPRLALAAERRQVIAPSVRACPYPHLRHPCLLVRQVDQFGELEVTRTMTLVRPLPPCAAGE